MSTSTCTAVAATHALPTTQTAGNFGLLPVERLRTRYAALRPGSPQRAAEEVAQLPIRVVPTEEGLYEVLDGFKRLEGWRQQGHPLIPVVIESPSSTAEHKRLLLLANCPARTLTALDEARVVCSLMSEEGLSPARIARQLEHKPQWVARRVDIGTRLSPTAENKLAWGEIGPTLAHALCALPAKDQDALLGAMQRHGLKLREALTLIGTYRLADEPDRRELLRSPLGVVRAEPSACPTTSPAATALERRLEHIQEALVSLADFVIPEELAPAEKRRLEARLRSVLAQLHDTACAQGIQQAASNPTGDPDEPIQRPTHPFPQPTSWAQAKPGEGCSSPGDSRRDPPAACLLRLSGDCPPGGLLAQDRSPGVERAGLPSTPRAHPQGEQARALPPDDRAEGQHRTDGHPDSARDPRAGLLGRTEHSRRVCTHPPREARSSAPQERQAPLRNLTR